jgi:DNA polymerase (family 10)
MAKDEGVPVSIASDAHSADGLDVLRFGVGQARRGWLEKGDVLNTLTLAELRRRLAQKARAAASPVSTS